MPRDTQFAIRITCTNIIQVNTEIKRRNP